MAKLRARGRTELHRLYNPQTDTLYAFMSDRKVLRHTGNHWVIAKLKQEMTPERLQQPPYNFQPLAVGENRPRRKKELLPSFQPYQSLVASEPPPIKFPHEEVFQAFMVGVEFGYLQCEKNNNLDLAKFNARLEWEGNTTQKKI